MSLYFHLFICFFTSILSAVAQAEIPFEIHTPYELGVTVRVGGSGSGYGSYYGESPYHIGDSYYCVDFNAPDNSGYVVTATANGRVVAVGRSSYYTSYTHDVAIEHEGGYYSLYMHLRSNNVSVGDEVRGGQIIGVEGSSGITSTGSHLHFCIFDSSGQSVKPSPMDGQLLEDDPNSLSYGQNYGYVFTSQNIEGYNQDNPPSSADFESALVAMEEGDLYYLNPFSGYGQGTSL